MTIFLSKITLDDPQMPVGNWHPFPPPEPGFYHLRQVYPWQGDQLAVPMKPGLEVFQGKFRCDLYQNRRVYLGGSKRLLCMSRRVSRMRPEDGWQFQFLPERSTARGAVQYRPVAVIYGLVDGRPVAVDRRDVSDQLPAASSKAEALYIVRSMPVRWPVFVRIHIEYTETVLSS